MDYKFAHYSVWISFQQPDCCFEKHEVIKGTFFQPVYLHQALANLTEIMKNICDREVGLMFYSTSLLNEGKGSVAVSNCPLLFLPTSFQTNGCCTMEPDYDVLASSKKEEEIAEAFTIYGWWWW